MLREQRVQVDVAHAVAVGQQERLVADVLLHALDARAGLRMEAGVHPRHAPRLRHVLVYRHAVFRREVKRYVAAVQIVIREILLDHVALVAAADDKIVKTERGVDLHDMP